MNDFWQDRCLQMESILAAMADSLNLTSQQALRFTQGQPTPKLQAEIWASAAKNIALVDEVVHLLGLDLEPLDPESRLRKASRIWVEKMPELLAHYRRSLDGRRVHNA